MRYGLLSDGKRQPRKQWKLDMEAQVKLFKQILMTKEVEMRLCNSRLDDLLEKTTENSSRNKDLLEKIQKLEDKLIKYIQRPRPPTFSNAFSTSSPSGLKPGENRTQPVKNVFSCPCPTINNNSTNWTFGINFNDRKYLSEGTHKGSFLPMVIQDDNTSGTPRSWCVSAMPAYENWSLEELRYQDYNIDKQSKLFCPNLGTTVYKFTPIKATETKVGFSCSQVISTQMMNITAMPLYSNKSPEELRLEDYILRKPAFINQKPATPKSYDMRVFSNTPIPGTSRCTPKWVPNHEFTLFTLPTAMDQGEASNSGYQIMFPGTPKKPPSPSLGKSFFRRQSPSNNRHWRVKTKDASTSVEQAPEQAVASEDKQSQLMQNILTELKGITDRFASLETRYTSLEGGIADVSSRLSVMDSKFSSVDMFLTMERFGKKWNALESKLATLECPTVENDLEALNNDKEIQCSLLKDDGEETKVSSVTKEDSFVKSPEIFSFGIGSKEENQTPFKFFYPVEFKDILTSTDQQTGGSSTVITDSQVDHLNSSPSVNRENVSDEQNTLNDSQNMDQIIGVDKMKSSIKVENEVNSSETFTKSSLQEIQTGSNTPTKEINQKQEEPLAQCETNRKSRALKECEEKDEQMHMKTPSNEEDDFVVVENSYFLNASEEIGEGDDSSRELHLADVTEYLEVASVKKINRKFELGVEATDTTMLELSASNSELQMSLDSAGGKNSSVLNMSADVSLSDASKDVPVFGTFFPVQSLQQSYIKQLAESFLSDDESSENKLLH